MKIVRYLYQGKTAYGLLESDTVFAMEGDLYGDKRRGSAVGAVADVRLVAPITPSKIIGIGLNYRAHAAESKKLVPTTPLYFFKPTTAIISPGESIVYPSQIQSKMVHHEGELVVVIGKLARRVSEAEALGHVLGYTCGNDVTARDIQNAEGHNSHAKSFDTFFPVGPAIATGLDPNDLRLVTRVNGQVRQDTRTSDMVFTVAQLVSYLSQSMTLQPGDVISTGTPSGVSSIFPGDVVEIDIEGIGVLRNTVAR
ncbi:MAG: fumarylacetoacetate hydrolase family protein [Chloroflexota bacterium]|nr:fumarylacetoacetate hydrolase family protein [Chloroflexota bacterium]